MVDPYSEKLLTVPSDERWVAFVDSIPSANLFHHPAWTNLFAECYGYRPFVVAICDDKGTIKAGIPLMEIKSRLTGYRWVSLPFTDHCSPLYNGGMPAEELFEYLSELQVEHGVPRVEIRNPIPYNGHVFQDSGQVLHLLGLSKDTHNVFRGFDHQVRKKNIARAQRDGVEVRWGENECDLETFYNLQLKTRHRLGVPIQPKRYFRLLWKRIIDPGLGYILLAFKDSIPIAGGVFLADKETLIFKHSASDWNYRSLRANHLLTWTAIRWGCEHGYTLFDWGKTDVNNTGLRKFKNGWGTRESVLTYSVLSAAPQKRNLNRFSDIMETVIRRTPPWVCQTTGEMLYRHFG